MRIQYPLLTLLLAFIFTNFSMQEVKHAADSPEMKRYSRTKQSANIRLLHGALWGNLIQVKQALYDGADINARRDSDDSTALINVIYAVMANYTIHNNRYMPILRYLLQQPHINVNLQTKETKSCAIFLASFFNNLEMFDELLQHGGSISLPNSKGDTAESIAQGAILQSINHYKLKLDAMVKTATETILEIDPCFVKNLGGIIREYL